ncbi:MAG: hypothetical protein ACI841_003324 [Planctomycetota bacterium]|jgi:hypothetical protein
MRGISHAERLTLSLQHSRFRIPTRGDAVRCPAGPEGRIALTGFNRALLLDASDGSLLSNIEIGEPRRPNKVYQAVFVGTGEGLQLQVASHSGLISYNLRANE